MKFSVILLIFCSFAVHSQYKYDPSEENPFGLPNPEAPQQIKDFEPMIGLCDCKSEIKKQDGTWADPNDMTWKFKYIMNGMAIQDETLKADGKHSGSIRQFNADSSRWYVHYYSSNAIPITLPSWEGNKKDDKIVLYREQKAPNGLDGFYRLTFYDITKNGYKWVGEWVDKTESVVFPTWKIECKKRTQ
ncbi:MAG: hypothetical protein R2797_05510 [Gelidibacter sp.]